MAPNIEVNAPEVDQKVIEAIAEAEAQMIALELHHRELTTSRNVPVLEPRIITSKLDYTVILVQIVTNFDGEQCLL